MKQSTVIFGTLIFAFFVYITMRGQLPRYRAIFGSGPSANVSSATGSGNVSHAADNSSTYDMQALNIWNRVGQ